MHKGTRILTVLLVLLLFVGTVSASDQQNLVATVGGVPITSFEMQREVNKIMPMLVSFHGKISQQKVEEIQQKALGNLIERGYKTCSAIKNNLTVAQSEVSAVIENARKQLSQEDFERAVGAETLVGVKDSVSRQLLADAAEKKFITDEISVQDSDVSAFYQKHKSSYNRPRQFRASHILVKVDPALTLEEKATLKAKAESLQARAVNGEDFHDLAYFNSDDRTKYVGGDIGLFHEGQTVPEFETALQKLQVGDISELVKTLYGYHIIKLTEKNEPRQLQFNEVADKIRTQLVDKQREELNIAWLEALKAECVVEKYPL